MPALARVVDDDCYSRAANDACINGGPWTRTKYTYDSADRQSSIKYPSGRIVTYTRDVVGRVSKVATTDVQSNTSTVADSIQYMPFGPATSWTLGNGIAVTRSYDQDYRLTNYADAGVLNRTLAYDTRNQITGVTDALVSANSQTMTYDNVGRVATATGPYGSLAWTYNGTGDRLTETRNSVVDNYAYGSGTHRLASISGGHSATFSFDAAGNATAKNGLSLSYNNAGRMASAMQLGTIEQNTYDAAGHRTLRSGSGGVVLYRYDSSGNVISEIGGSGAALGEYIYLNGLPLAYARTGDAIVPLAPTTSIYYFHSDQLGTPQKLTDANKAVVWAATYEPYGNVSLSTATITNPLRFPGQYFDAETGLYQNWFRDYDPSIGRYLQSDPIGLDGGLNTYGYALQDPISKSDPLGLETTVACRAIHHGNPVIEAGLRMTHRRHCFVVVWHRASCGSQNQIVDAQFSLAGSQTPFPQDMHTIPGFTFGDDRHSWDWGTAERYDISPVPRTHEAFDQAVIEAGSNYNSGEPYDKWGPNSNTATNNIIKNAGGEMPNVFGATGQYYGEH